MIFFGVVAFCVFILLFIILLDLESDLLIGNGQCAPFRSKSAETLQQQEQKMQATTANATELHAADETTKDSAAVEVCNFCNFFRMLY